MLSGQPHMRTVKLIRQITKHYLFVSLKRGEQWNHHSLEWFSLDFKNAYV